MNTLMTESMLEGYKAAIQKEINLPIAEGNFVLPHEREGGSGVLTRNLNLSKEELIEIVAHQLSPYNKSPLKVVDGHMLTSTKPKNSKTTGNVFVERTTSTGKVQLRLDSVFYAVFVSEKQLVQHAKFGTNLIRLCDKSNCVAPACLVFKETRRSLQAKRECNDFCYVK